MRTPALLAPLLLTGCAASSAVDAPSLAPRAIESRSDAEPTYAPSTVAPEPALDVRIVERVAAFDRAAKTFDATRAPVTARITRGKGAVVGSERWLDAQSALGELQQTRTASEDAMAELEALAIERATAGAAPYPALDAALEAAGAKLAYQAEVEAGLKAALG